MTSVARVETKGTAITLSNGEQLREFLMERQGEFAAIAKAGGFQPEALVLELVGMVRKKPEILTCTPDSIMTFIHDVAKIGLVIGRGCFPVPVKDHGVAKLECWIGYKGMKELVKYGGGARDVFAEVVYEGDEFEEPNASTRACTCAKSSPCSSCTASRLSPVPSMMGWSCRLSAPGTSPISCRHAGASVRRLPPCS